MKNQGISMHIIKLDATRSTNETLKTLWREGSSKDGTVIWALDQYEGRGQKGTSWESQPGKNLTFSILKKFDDLEAHRHFAVNLVVSIALYKALTELNIPGLRVKWPNDIMSGSQKIGGILIENFVKAKMLQASVIGIGLNVNQEDFGQLTSAASLKTVTGSEYKLEDVLDLLLEKLKDQWPRLAKEALHTMKQDYESVMYRIGLNSRFEFPDGNTEQGCIRGVDDNGRLLVELSDRTQSFDLKEIRLLN